MIFGRYGYVDVEYCETYHPYRCLGQLNPYKNDITFKLMDFKNADHPKNDEALAFFSRLVIDVLCTPCGKNGRPSPLDEDVQFAIVPSHEQHVVSPALVGLVSNVAGYFGIENTGPLLNRDQTVTSAHNGGDRSIRKHMNSISVDRRNLDRSLPVILIDDVSTTGGSMSACFHLLKNAGAPRVYPVSVLKTATY